MTQGAIAEAFPDEPELLRPALVEASQAVELEAADAWLVVAEDPSAYSAATDMSPLKDVDSRDVFDVDEPVEAEANPTADLDKAAPSADLVRVYLNEIGKVALLTAVEEVELSKRIEAGLYAGKLHELLNAGPSERMQKLADLANKAPVKGQKQADTAPTPPDKLLNHIENRIAEIESMGPIRQKRLKRDLQLVIADGERAKDHLLRANLRLVVSLAKRYTGHGMAFLDLIQEGNLGLVRAVEKFDYTKGFKFSTYATWWIRQGISRAMADQSRTIRLPVHLVEQVNKMQRQRRELSQALGREATHDEIGHELDITPERVRELIDVSRDIVSLDLNVGTDDEASLGDFIPDPRTVGEAESTAETKQMHRQLNDVLSTLEEREAAVIRMRYGLDGAVPRTLDDIGRAFKLSRERIRQIERETMAKLRHPSRAQILREYLDN